MFDTMVKPILMYGCEVYGLKKGTPNCVLYGELGRFAIDIEIKSRMVAFWKKIICNKQVSLYSYKKNHL
jgi:hypothetical protein